jgi:hypothetical protein
MTVNDELRRRLAQLARTLDALDATLIAGGDDVPAMQLARLLLAVDAAAAEIGRHAEDLATLRRENWPP